MDKKPPRRRRFISPKVELTLKEIEALPKRSRGPKRNPASKLKYAMKKFIGKSTNKRVTPNTKRVADVLIDWYRPGRRHSWASREINRRPLGVGTPNKNRAQWVAARTRFSKKDDANMVHENSEKCKLFLVRPGNNPAAEISQPYRPSPSPGARCRRWEVQANG